MLRGFRIKPTEGLLLDVPAKEPRDESLGEGRGWSRSTPPPGTICSRSSRSGRRSTIVTSQIPLNRWHEIIGDPTYADAILDRLVHNAHRIELTSESMRRTRGKPNQKA